MAVFNVETHFLFSSTLMLVELRLYPILASALMLISLPFLLGGPAGIKRARVPFFLGLGFMTYSLFRFFLLYSFDGLPYWMNFREEITELIATFGLGVFLFIFRHTLGIPFPLSSKAKTTSKPMAS